jgi:hypothetical protein
LDEGVIQRLPAHYHFQTNPLLPLKHYHWVYDKEVRRAWYNEEWYYSLVDIVAVLSESKNPTDYLKKIRQRNDELKTYTSCTLSLPNQSFASFKTLSLGL